MQIQTLPSPNLPFSKFCADEAVGVMRGGTRKNLFISEWGHNHAPLCFPRTCLAPHPGPGSLPPSSPLTTSGPAALGARPPVHPLPALSSPQPLPPPCHTDLCILPDLFLRCSYPPPLTLLTLIRLCYRKPRYSGQLVARKRAAAGGHPPP